MTRRQVLKGHKKSIQQVWSKTLDQTSTFWDIVVSKLTYTKYSFSSRNN